MQPYYGNQSKSKRKTKVISKIFKPMQPYYGKDITHIIDRAIQDDNFDNVQETHLRCRIAGGFDSFLLGKTVNKL